MRTLYLIATAALLAFMPLASGYVSASAGGYCEENAYLTNGVYLWTLSQDYGASAGFDFLDVGATASVEGDGAPLLYHQIETVGWLGQIDGGHVHIDASASDSSMPYGTPYNSWSTAHVFGGFNPGTDSANAGGTCTAAA